MKKLIIAAAMVALASGCGPSSPVTTYVVNTDNQLNVAKGTNAQCSAADPQQDTTTTNEKSDSLLTLWTESDGTVYAEFAGKVYTGKKSSNSYNLTDSSSIDDQSQQNRDAITSDVYTLSMTSNGSFMSGSITHEHHQSCGGNNCSTAEQTTIDCIYTTNLRGEQLPNDGAEAGLPTPGGG